MSCGLASRRVDMAQSRQRHYGTPTAHSIPINREIVCNPVRSHCRPLGTPGRTHRTTQLRDYNGGHMRRSMYKTLHRYLNANAHADSYSFVLGHGAHTCACVLPAPRTPHPCMMAIALRAPPRPLWFTHPHTPSLKLRNNVGGS